MDSLEELLGFSPDDPVMRRAEVLVANDRELLNDLIAIRKRSMKQIDVARELGISQASVASFERFDNDPKLSTIRRYAQAIGALVSHRVAVDTGQLQDHRASEWTTVTLPKLDVMVRNHNLKYANHHQVSVFADLADSKRTDFALGA